MTNLKRVILTIVMVSLVCLCAGTVFATNDGFIDINEGISGATGNTANTATNTTTNTATNTSNTGNTANLIGGNNTSTYTNTTLPQTGAGDYAMILMIGVLGVVAIYAYKKVRDYKNV